MTNLSKNWQLSAEDYLLATGFKEKGIDVRYFQKGLKLVQITDEMISYSILTPFGDVALQHHLSFTNGADMDDTRIALLFHSLDIVPLNELRQAAQNAGCDVQISELFHPLTLQ